MMKEYLSIQEFSKRSGVGISTLRYWDDIGLFSPIKRNPENNYRQYSLAQIITLNFITTLSRLNIPLKDIAGLHKDRTPEKFLDILHMQEMKLDRSMRELRLQYSVIHARRELISNGFKADTSKISVVHREDRPIKLWPLNAYEEGDTFLSPLSYYIGKAEEYHINLGFPIGGYFNSIESYFERPNCPDRFFTIDPESTATLKSRDYIIGYGDGADGVLKDLPQRMKAFIDENELIPTGPAYVVLLFDEICTRRYVDNLAEVGVAAVKRKHQERNPHELKHNRRT